MKSLREEFVDDAQKRCGQIGRDLSRPFAARQHPLEELGRSWDVASFRHVHVDDVAGPFDCSVHVSPDGGDLDVGLIDEPPTAGGSAHAASAGLPGQRAELAATRCLGLGGDAARSVSSFDSMQRIVTGVDDDGRSCVVSRDVPEAVAAGPGSSLIDTLFETAQVPPRSGPAGRGEYLDLGVGPGLVKWFIVEYEPDASFSMHTDTVDFDTVLAGSLELVLDDGVHALGPGDCVVISGVDHAWRVGTDGCRMGVVMLGTLPPSK